MCRFKSGILLRDRAYVPDHDKHDKMLKELGIQNDYIGASKKFVRFELYPKDGNLSTDVSTWFMKVDQDIVPSWFEADMKKSKEIIVDAVRRWAEEHIIKDGKHEKTEGFYYLVNDAEITLLDNAQAALLDNARATLWDNARATLWDNAQAELWDNAQAELLDNSQATLWGNARATLRNNANAMLRDRARATLVGNARATLVGNAQATLCGSAIIGNCTIFDNAIVISHKDSKVYVSKKWDMEVIQ